MSDEPIRILLVDDHPMLREGLRRSLVGQGYDVIGEAGDGQQAVDLAQALRPNLVLMDVTMPVLDGIEAARRIIEQQPGIAILMLTMHADTELAQRAMEIGAMGYLVKDCSLAEIAEAVESAVAGHSTFPVDASQESEDDRPRITRREIEVLQLIADGKSTSETAHELFVSTKTVKNHLASAYTKLEAHDRTQAVLRAARLGLIKLSR
jgi:two-component system, NarL family, response regulator DegU